jgi:hypothetical protein
MISSDIEYDFEAAIGEATGRLDMLLHAAEALPI